MPLKLGLGTKPALEVKTYGSGPRANTVDLGMYEISMEDFAAMVIYVLTNAELGPDDPRLELVRRVRTMQVIDGYTLGKRRLELESVAVRARS